MSLNNRATYLTFPNVSPYHFAGFADTSGNPAFVKAEREIKRILKLFQSPANLGEANLASIKFFQDLKTQEFKPSAKITCLGTSVDNTTLGRISALSSKEALSAYLDLLADLLNKGAPANTIIQLLNQNNSRNTNFAMLMAVKTDYAPFKQYMDLLSALIKKGGSLDKIREGFTAKNKSNDDFLAIFLKNQTELNMHEILFESGIITKDNKDRLVDSFLAISDKNTKKDVLVHAFNAQTEVGKFIRIKRLGTETNENSGSLERIKQALHVLEPENEKYKIPSSFLEKAFAFFQSKDGNASIQAPKETDMRSKLSLSYKKNTDDK